MDKLIEAIISKELEGSDSHLKKNLRQALSGLDEVRIKMIRDAKFPLEESVRYELEKVIEQKTLTRIERIILIHQALSEMDDDDLDADEHQANLLDIWD